MKTRRPEDMWLMGERRRMTAVFSPEKDQTQTFVSPEGFKSYGMGLLLTWKEATFRFRKHMILFGFCLRILLFDRVKDTVPCQSPHRPHNRKVTLTTKEEKGGPFMQVILQTANMQPPFTYQSIWHSSTRWTSPQSVSTRPFLGELNGKIRSESAILAQDDGFSDRDRLKRNN